MRHVPLLLLLLLPACNEPAGNAENAAVERGIERSTRDVQAAEAAAGPDAAAGTEGAGSSAR